MTPQAGANPASSLKGASNILIQSVCKGRKTSHVGALFDSVTWAALFDAVAHSGPAKTPRFPKTVCAKPFGPGIDAAQTWVVLAVAARTRLDRFSGVPVVASEPAVAAYAKR